MSPQQRCLNWLAALRGDGDNDNDDDDIERNHLKPGSSPRNASPHDSAFADSPPLQQLKRKREDCCWDLAPLTMDNLEELRRANEDVTDDIQRTPRPTKRPKRHRDDGDSVSTHESRSGAASSRTDNSRRSSPVKQINKLWRLEDAPIRDGNLSASIAKFSPEARQLIQNLNRCTTLRGKVPMSLKDSLRSRYAYEDVWNSEDIWWDDSGKASDSNQFQSDAPTLREVQSIACEAADLNQHDALEAAWNTHSQGPLLVLARNLSPYGHLIWTANITSARPYSRLNPGLDETISTKMVDFAILLKVDQDDDLVTAYTKVSKGHPEMQSLNHTNAESICKNPIAISIETKRAHTGGAEGKLQLRVWAHTHLRWLAEVRGIPPVECTVYLPCLLVVGSSWYYTLVQGVFNGQGQLDRTVVFREIHVGDVSDLKGVFQVLAVLLVLIKWAATEWRPWLLKWLGLAGG